MLLLSTYPIVEPRHGGQIRLKAIKNAFEGAGWHVTSLAVYTEESYRPTEIGPYDVAFPRHSPYRKYRSRKIPNIADLLAGHFAQARDGGFDSCLARIPKKVDVVHVEQPWLWPLASELRRQPQYTDAVYVYGSANIETPLKRSIFKELRIAEDGDDLFAEIDALEKRAAREADAAVAVTEEDMLVLSAWGAKSVLHCPNGTAAVSADQKRMHRWQKLLPPSPWLLYAASAHAPNFSRFLETFDGSLACFPPSSRLVVVGSVCERIQAIVDSNQWSDLNRSRLQLLFGLSEEDFAAVKSLAHGFILPILYGGGSNVKTAEALYSGAYVIGTPAAFRGFERFLDLPEVLIASSSKSFQSAIRKVLVLPDPRPTGPGSSGDLRQELRWEACLGSLEPTIEFMLLARGRR